MQIPNILSVVILSVFVQSSFSNAEEDHLNMLSHAVIRRGDRDIHTGEFRFHLRVTEEELSNEVIAEHTERVRSAWRDVLIKNKNPAIAKNLQTAIDTAGDDVPDQAKKNSDMTFQCFFALGGPELGGDRYMEIYTMYLDKSSYGGSQKLLLRSQGSSRMTGMELDHSGRRVIVGNARQYFYQPSQEPQRLGRANGSLSHLVPALDAASVREWLFKSVSDLQVTPVADEQEVGTFQLEFKLTVPYPDSVKAQLPKDAPVSNTVSMIYHIVPSRGYITPLIRETDPAGQVIFEWVSSDYFQPAGSDLWFPQTCESRTFMLGKKEPRVERYSFEKDGVQLNHKIPNERFSVSIPTKTTVIDATGAVHKNYVTTRAVMLTIDDAAQLSQLDGFVVAPEPEVLGKPRVLANNPIRFWLFWSNIMALVGFAWWLIKRQAKQAAEQPRS